ncbi:hypothetical protein [Candidatus Formimonas warabiya]|uniref:Uncharacterized protein n=1 Tax=Formimonas warabiya TaxID=1761012 RepID=A0A3G1KZV9_FORW1|nr:hypothetical protein [Candidatus Formimonas warabiya]ATW27950.1 hypothetical protein DCMF_27200 [Candidatus Formimonas warabiya]
MALTLKLGGVDKTDLLRRGDLKITDELNTRSTADFTLTDGSGLYRSEPGTPVEIWDGATLVFAGTVDELEETKFLGIPSLEEQVPCVDYCQVCDRFLVAETYQNVVAGAIVRDILVKYLQTDGIGAGTIQDGPVIQKAIFPYMTVTQCFNEICELTGYQWNINPDKTLRFFERTTYSAPWSIDSTNPNCDFREVKVRRHRDNYRNRQYLRGGTDISLPQTRTFKGNGETTVFSVDLPIATTPTVLVNGVSKTVGIRNVDQNKEWYWQKGDKEISQAQGGAKLSASETLTVTYQGFYPIVIVSENPGAIGERKTVEGGSGIYEAMEYQAKIETKDAAFQYSDGLLRKYASIGRVLNYATFTPGLRAGQLQSINIPEHNIHNELFLISKVTISDPGSWDQRLAYEVEALDGETVGGWTNFFRKLTENKAEYVIRENEILVKLLTFRDSVMLPKVEDDITYNLHQYLICGNGTICGTGVMI